MRTTASPPNAARGDFVADGPPRRPGEPGRGAVATATPRHHDSSPMSGGHAQTEAATSPLNLPQSRVKHHA